MKIAIIGGGWVGCHLSLKLLGKNHNVTLFERNNELFNETSYNNQNRLHYGFHYARNYKTRELCRTTFPVFLNEYGFLTEKIQNNLYCVPSIKSNIDFETYIKIFDGFEMENTTNSFKNIENCIKINERYIDFKMAHDFFNEKLKNIFICKDITSKKLTKMSKEYDLVINATNNQIKNNLNNNFYELTISLIYEKTKKIDFGAVTLVDGSFFSIYPYKDNLYTLTDVEFTPLKKFKQIKTLDKFKRCIDDVYVFKRKNSMEQKVKEYFPEFLDYFKYNSYFLSTKSKAVNSSDERYPVVTVSDNVINCFTGKIQGIFIIENYINNIIDFYEC